MNGFNPFALLPLLPVITKHSDLIKQIVAILPDAEATITEMEAVYNKHQVTINQLIKLTPEIQQAVNEGLAALNQ